MEDDFKNIWKSIGIDQKAPSIDFSKLKEEKSLNIIDRLRRNLKIEHYFNMIFCPFLIAHFIWIKNIELAISSTVIIGFFILYYQRLLNKLRRYSLSENVIDYLKTNLVLFKAFNRHYNIASLLLILYCILFGIPAYADSSFMQFWPEKIKEQAFMLSTFISLFSSCLFVFGYIYFVYGKHLKKLRWKIQSLEQ